MTEQQRKELDALKWNTGNSALPFERRQRDGIDAAFALGRRVAQDERKPLLTRKQFEAVYYNHLGCTFDHDCRAITLEALLRMLGISEVESAMLSKQLPSPPQGRGDAS